MSPPANTKGSSCPLKQNTFPSLISNLSTGNPSLHHVSPRLHLPCSDFLSSLNFGQVTDRHTYIQKVLHMSPPCMSDVDEWSTRRKHNSTWMRSSLKLSDWSGGKVSLITTQPSPAQSCSHRCYTQWSTALRQCNGTLAYLSAVQRLFRVPNSSKVWDAMQTVNTFLCCVKYVCWRLTITYYYSNIFPKLMACH